MAQSQDAHTGEKRGPGRPPRAAQPALKKTRLSSTAQPRPSSTQSPSAQSPAPEKKLSKLPYKISDLRPLPALTKSQAPALSNEEYQSIAASAVLHASLDRSRVAWVHDGVFERYWTKPDSGKNARPPPPNNPELKWQKHRGPCRIRIEPHIFEAEMYVEEKPRPAPPPVKQYTPNPSFGQPYRPQQQHQYGGQQYYQNQNRNLPPPQPPNTLPPLSNSPPSAAQQQGAAPAQQQQAQGQEKKASPDPVISMLANRASSDPELKRLMKEVATGNATQEQLKVFQGHIDELTRVINEKKKSEGDSTAASPAPTAAQGDAIQYDASSEAPSALPPAPATPVQQQPRPPPYQPQPQQPMYQHQQTWAPPAPPPAPTALPVILQFTTPGATDDRFLFPQHSILESLSPQHLLASFLMTRQASTLPSTTVSELGLDVSKEYYQPITLMVEVAYNREHLLELVKRWVKPVDDAKKFMEETMARCERAPDVHLALRLPFKGSQLAADAEEISALEALALAEKEREKEGQKKTVKYVKKNSLASSGPSTPVSKGTSVDAKKGVVADGVKGAVNGASAASATSTQANAVPDAGDKEDMAPVSGATAAEANGEAAAKKEGEEQATTESGRPRRTTRKSVRISEG